IAALENLYIGPKAALLGAIAGYVSLWSVWWVFKQLTGKEGMGHGDFKLLAALGAWCGLAGVLPIILISSLVGAVIGSAWLFAKGRD
ncbi:prepilin peptidase, partial [Klebsiella pneumoniae]|uniref:prepilin peptidase n=1 Tax=Klebsiella pneumoniae TaxID=573 RepID=UPI00226E1D74